MESVTVGWGPDAHALLSDPDLRAQVDPGQLRALEAVAVLGPSSSAELEEIGGPDLARGVLAAAEAGYLTFGGDDPDWIPAGADVLHAELRHDHPERVTDLLRAQADVRERTGAADAGLRAARRLGDDERVARILDRWGVDLAHSRYAAVVHASAAELPLELARERPGLAWRFEDLGRIPVGTVPVDLPATAQDAKDEVLKNGDLLLTQVLQPLNTRRRLYRWDAAMSIVRAADPLAQACVYPWYGDRSSILPYWYLQAGITAGQVGDLATSSRYLVSAWTYRERDGYGHTARATAAQAALLDVFLGNGTASTDWQEKAAGEQRQADLWMDRFREAVEAAAAAGHAIDALDEDAEATLLPSFHPSQRHGQWPLFLWLHVRQALAHHDIARARRYVVDTVAVRTPEETRSGLAALMVPLVRAQIHLASGQANQALTELENVPDLVGLTRVVRARTLLLANRPIEALDVLSSLARDTTTSPRARVEGLLLEAAAHLGTDRRAAVSAATKAVTQVVEQQVPLALAGVRRSVLDDLAPDVPALVPLLALLDERGITDTYPGSIEVISVTERERALLRDLGSGQTLAEIAQAHYVSVNTIRTHLANLRKKLDARSRDEVLVKAKTIGLLD